MAVAMGSNRGRWLASAATLVLTSSIAGIGHAEAAPAAAASTVEEVVVTGFRASQAAALDIKKASDEIVEAITAEDIGKLPDESIADSIARLPGLAAQRDNNGRWQDISVNGLPPSMSTTLFNGRLQATTDNNRVTQFDQYPAEILNSVVVYKTGDANLVGGAIATVDMRTIRPLDYGKTTLAVGAQGEYDTRGALQSGADAKGWRVNGTYISQFFDNTLGVMVGASHMVAPNQIYAQHPYGFNEPNDVVTGLQDQVRSDTLTRDGYVATLQWKPNDRLSVTFDGFMSDYKDDALIRGVEIQTACCGNATQVGTPTQGQSSWIVAPQLENYDYTDKASLRTFGATLKYDLGGGWQLTGDAGYSDARRRNQRIELYNGFGINGSQNTSTVTLTSGAARGGMIGASNWSENISNPGLVAIGENLSWQQGWWPSVWPGGNVGGLNLTSLYGASYFQQVYSLDMINETNWSLAHDLNFGPISKIDFGLAFNSRKKNYIDHEGVGYLTGRNEAAAIPASVLQSPTDLSAFGLPSVVSIDAGKAWTSGLYAFNERPDEIDKDWAVRENVYTPYVEAKIDSSLAGRPLTGNIGVQAVYTDQRVSNVAQAGGWPSYTFIPYTTDTRYWEILPSVNLTWRLDDEHQLRLGLARSMARPRFDTMGGSASINYNAANANSTSLSASPWSGSVGNPSLKPWISDDFDVTGDWFFAPGEGVSVEGFYKNLESFIYNKTTIFNFQQFYSANLFQPTPKLFLGPVSEYENASGGSIYGVVVSGNLSLKHLSPMLDGFGISATATSLESSVNIPDPNTSPSGQIPELSRFVGNISLYWEKDGFSARINDRYRSKYVQEVPNFDGTLQAIEGASENTVDLQLGYQVLQGNLKGLSFTFSAENLTDTPMNSYVGGNAAHPEYYKLFGPNVLFGVNYRY